MTPTAHPLQWPAGFPRSKSQEKSRFKTTLPQALKNVEDSLNRFANDSSVPVNGIVLSSNVTLGSYSPEDPGVAVWFNWDGEMRCVPCDRYTSVADNLQAIHHIIEARRVELRHGTLHLVRAAFAGFKALPAPPGKSWREILKIGRAHASVSLVEDRYRLLAKTAHPDAGGSAEAMAELNNAKETALREIG